MIFSKVKKLSPERAFIRVVRYTIWLWNKSTMWLLILKSSCTSFMVRRSRVLHLFRMKDAGRWLPWVLPGSTGRFYKDDVVHNHSAHGYYITRMEGGVRYAWYCCYMLNRIKQNWAKIAIHITRELDLVTFHMKDYFFFIKNWKTSAVSTTMWMVEIQLCKLRGTSDIYTNYRSPVFYGWGEQNRRMFMM